MTISYIGATSNPADLATLLNTGVVAVTPANAGSQSTGDLILMIGAVRSSTASMAISATGGQSWTAETLLTGAGSINYRLFWCRFNGTWGANPSIVSDAPVDKVVSLEFFVFRPTSGSNTWAVDVVQTDSNFSAPVAPGDVTAMSKTAIAANTVTFWTWVTNAKDTFAIQGGIPNAGGAQYRSNDSAASNKRDQTLSFAYKIQTSAGATGTVTNRETTSTTHQGRYSAITFKEQSASLTIASVSTGATPILNGQSIIFTGTKSGASWSSVKFSPTNNIADGAAVTQSITGSTATTFTIGTPDLSSFATFTDIYVFATDSSANSNSTGFAIQRGSQLTISGLTLVSNPPTLAPQASLTGIQYDVNPTDLATDPILSGTNATTNGSGVLSTIGPYTLVSGGPIARGDDVILFLFKDNATQALSLSSLNKITPTYS